LKATIEKPKERMVTLTMTESDAKTLMNFAPNMTTHALADLGASYTFAVQGEAIFRKIKLALENMEGKDELRTATPTHSL